MNSSDAVRKFELFMFNGQMQIHQGNNPCLPRWPAEQSCTELFTQDDSNSIAVGIIKTDLETGKEVFIRTYPPVVFKPKPQKLVARAVFCINRMSGEMQMIWV